MNNRNHTKLICDVSELTGLFSDAKSLSAFLQRIVSMISTHMQCDVCSIYLYYEQNQELVLSATKGLKQEAIGQVKLKYGEGLTGKSLKELRPLSVGKANEHPEYHFFPGIGEEQYQSFLAVPILRGTTRIGVIVIQSIQPNFFSPEDLNVFRAITSQLANTIETAKLLIALEDDRQVSIEPIKTDSNLKLINGSVGAEGMALAKSLVFDEVSVSPWDLANLDQTYTKDDFHLALKTTEKQLKELQNQIEEKLFDVASLIFTAQILMLKDEAFVQAIEAKIDEGVNAPIAIDMIVNDYVHRFEQMGNDYLREKAHDVKDVGRRMLENILGKSIKTADLSGKIVIAQEFLPSDALKLYSQHVAGIIITSGGATSHLSILCRSLNIPLIIAHEKQLLYLEPDTAILLDGQTGQIHINPNQDVVKAVEDKFAIFADADSIKEQVNDATLTSDKEQVKLLANINLLGDLKVANDFKTEGVGLYRTEFPFMMRSNFPSEEEQVVIYRKLVEQMKNKEITFRTLDIGGDKVVSYYDFFGKEENPFLGLRSIRFSLEHQDIFKQQLRAILRAAHDAPINIMFPMIASLEQLAEAKSILQKAQNELTQEKVDHAKDIKIGMMVELPSVLELLEEFAKEVDFFSIGTNDLVQYMLAVDRTNEKVASLYLPHHPSVLRALNRIMQVANEHDKSVSICGDMAHEECYLPFLLGIGIRRLSLDARYLPQIQKAIAALSIDQCKNIADSMLKASSIKEIDAMLN